MGAEHWDAVYQAKSTDEVSWYEQDPATSLRLIRGAASAGRVVDVGAGASFLADRLTADGYDVTVLDISATALAQVRARLGGSATYVVTDLLAWEPTTSYDVWHDRAVFHFLTDPAEQRSYIELATATIRAGGVLVLGTFAPDGPESCSGLPTARYAPGELGAMFADGFDLAHAEVEAHHTPWGATQSFTWVVLQRPVADY